MGADNRLPGRGREGESWIPTHAIYGLGKLHTMHESVKITSTETVCHK